MKILVTNDDGYMALGIKTLTEVASRLGSVSVVAPDREQSAKSHSLTLHFPLRVREASPGVQVVDGTPTDCVMLAIGTLLEAKPDFVLSGVNHGGNLGDDVLYPDLASRLGSVSVVAPDREQSAKSHSLTLHFPLRVREASPGVQVVDGTPTDCVMLAIGTLLEEKPDFVLSGVNHGGNLGDDVLY